MLLLLELPPPSPRNVKRYSLLCWGVWNKLYSTKFFSRNLAPLSFGGKTVHNVAVVAVVRVRDHCRSFSHTRAHVVLSISNSCKNALGDCSARILRPCRPINGHKRTVNTPLPGPETAFESTYDFDDLLSRSIRRKSLLYLMIFVRTKFT